MVAISRLGGVVAAVTLGAGALIAGPASAFAQTAATIVVPCSTGALVNAINAANSSLTATTLQLSSNCTYAIVTPAAVLTGLPAINNDITLAGGANTVITRSVQASTLFSLLVVTSSGDLTVRNLALTRGISNSGGAIADDGGRLSVTDSRISGNSSTGGGGGVSLSAGSSAFISRTLINQNHADIPGGGIFVDGSLELFNTVIDDNSANFGAGLYISGAGSVTTEQTTITNNMAFKDGGGIYNIGTLALNGSQVRLNTADSVAGGIISTTNVTLRSTIVKKNTPDNCLPGFFCLN